MSVVSTTLDDFGKSLGLSGLTFEHSGTAMLEIEGMGSLFIEQGVEEVFIYLARTIPPFTDGAYAKAMQLCHFDQGHQFDIQVGLKGDDMLVFLARIPEHEFTLPTIDRCLNILEHLHDSVTKQ